MCARPSPHAREATAPQPLSRPVPPGAAPQAPETLRAALVKVAGAGARGSMVTIRADARATHQAVVTAMDVAGRLGFVQVTIATVNQQPGG